MTLADRAIQDYYADDFAHCYGCGRLNRDGLHVRTVWDGTETVAEFTPRAEHMAVPGFVYGGVIASIIDCHGIGTAAAASERAAGREPGDATAPRFVTAALHVDFLKPTPLGPPLVIRAAVKEAGARKTVVTATLSVQGIVTVRGEIVAVPMPATMTAPALGA